MKLNRSKVKVIQVEAEVITPMVPNFLKLEDGRTLPLCAITQEGLQKIAEAFGRDLIARANEQKKNAAKWMSDSKGSFI